MPDEELLDELENAFEDEEILMTPEQLCALENPESCESCQ